MSPRFCEFIPVILKLEGGEYTDDPNDNGGATRWGIDASNHPGVDIKNLTRDGATAIYWQEWRRENCEAMPYPMGELYFDACVNSGPRQAALFLERGATPALFLDAYDDFYRLLAHKYSHDAGFLKGWLARDTALRERFGIAQRV